MTEILNATRRLPFEMLELQQFSNLVAANQRSGLDTRASGTMGDERTVIEMLQDGVMILWCREMLGIDVVFVKLDGGKGFFGGQKSLFATYIGSEVHDDFSPGPTFKMWGMALTSINNIYRGHGFLKGAVK
ncbi:hypothetical protein [uncultured Propionivibrio sp.]|uniref:hypothetical protein n=1 Tax=uncultured Propionivibrio sp. TaxID=426737 RepID=UPI0029C036CF|nr:hypothetical protein [uncultured Propionivibrio sp.]